MEESEGRECKRERVIERGRVLTWRMVVHVEEASATLSDVPMRANVEGISSCQQHTSPRC